jgi:hypothetical protein
VRSWEYSPGSSVLLGYMRDILTYKASGVGTPLGLECRTPEPLAVSFDSPPPESSIQDLLVRAVEVDDRLVLLLRGSVSRAFRAGGERSGVHELVANVTGILWELLRYMVSDGRIYVKLDALTVQRVLSTLPGRLWWDPGPLAPALWLPLVGLLRS